MRLDSWKDQGVAPIVVWVLVFVLVVPGCTGPPPLPRTDQPVGPEPPPWKCNTPLPPDSEKTCLKCHEVEERQTENGTVKYVGRVKAERA